MKCQMKYKSIRKIPPIQGGGSFKVAKLKKFGSPGLFLKLD